MEEIRTTNQDISRHSQYLEQEQLILKEHMSDMEYTLEEFKKHIPGNIRAKLDAKINEKNASVVVSKDPDRDEKAGVFSTVETIRDNAKCCSIS